MIDVRPGCNSNESIKVVHKNGITEKALNARIDKEIRDREAADFELRQEIEHIEAGVEVYLSVVQNLDGSIKLVLKNKYGEVIDEDLITTTTKIIDTATLSWDSNTPKIIFTCLDESTFECDLTDIKETITNEIARATEAEAILTNNLATEISRATAKENALATDLANEVARATAKENTIATDLEAETTRASTAEANLAAALTTESTRALAAEGDLATSISNETSARKVADITLDTKIATEQARAEGAEATLEQNLAQEIQDRANADTVLNTAITAEQTRAQAAESTLTTNLNAEISTRHSADITLQANIATEAAARLAGDAALDTKITSEVSRATEVENTLSQNLLSETDTRSAADATLQANINTVDDKLNYNVHIETNQSEIEYHGDTVTKTSPYRNLKTGAAGSRSEVIQLANSTTAGLMAHSDYNQIRSNTSRIEALEGQTKRLLYTDKANPTAQEIQDFVDAYLESIHVTPSPEEYVSIGVVVSATYHIWHYYFGTGWKDDGTDTVTQFTNNSPGIIQGKATDGFVYAENDGTGSVYGWDAIKNRISNTETNITSLNNSKVDKISGSSLVPDTKVSAYDAHLINTSNPHSVTKAQVGLGNVDNTSDLDKPISTATQGALDNKVDKVAGSSLVEDTKVIAYDAHLENTSNPHQVTKAQVGLGNVDNKSEATIKADFTGSISEDNTGFALGGDVYTELGGKVDKETGKSLIENSKVISYDNHLLDTSNPHAVTAAQVGLGNVVNTGDSATPVLGGTDKFTTGGAYTELAKKVDKEAGKGLSTNDFTDSYKSQVEANTTARHTHSNKQALDTISQSDITNWNSKVSANDATIRILVDNVEVDSFTLNQSNDESINITTATKIESISIDDYTLPISHKNVNIPTVRTDISNQGLTGTQKINAKTNLDLNNVDNTSDLNKPVSTAQREAIDLVASNLSSHESDISNPHSVTKAQVGLGNVDNTADLDKPISTATQTALDGKVPTTRTVNGHALSSDVTVTKGDVGLGNVDNTSDLNKPISTATQTALDTKLNKSTQTNKVYGTDSQGSQTLYDVNSFGKVDDVKVDGTSVVTNKIANIDLTGKADKVVAASGEVLNGKLAGLDANGNLVNSNIVASEVALTSDITAAIEALDITSITNTAGKTISTITEQDGLIGATFQDIQVTESQVTNLTSDLSSLGSRIGAVEELIPAQASTSNQLADRDFVTSSISTAAADFLGTYNIVTDLGLTIDATEQQIIAALELKLASLSLVPTNNDYVYIAYPDQVISTQYTKFDRYKYTDNEESGSTPSWGYEFTLNNSSFTSDEWAAIQSGITATKVTNYDLHLANVSNPHSVTKAQVGLGNVDNKSEATIKSDFTGSIASGNTGFVTGGDAYTALDGKVDKETGKSLVEDAKVSAYDAHLLNTNNPHSVTKSQVGLGNVDNTSDATKKSNFTGSITSGNNGFVTGGDVYTELNTKVDKVQGKGLSEEDFTSTLKTKLEGIESGAEVNVNADWNASSGDAQILNKPTTIAGYGITDAYTKTETATQISNAINALDLSEVGANGSYIKLVSQTDGQLAATAHAFDQTIGGSSTHNNAPTSAAVVNYVDDYGGKIDSISLNGTALTIDQNKNVDIPISLTSTAGSEAVTVNGTSLNVLTRDTAQIVSAQKTIDSGVKLAFGTSGNYIKGVAESGDVHVLEIYSDYLTRILGVTTLDTASIANLNLDTFGDYRTVRNVGWFDSKISSMYEDTSSGESEWKKSTYGVKLPNTAAYVADKVLATTDDITTSLLNYYTSSQTDALLDTKQNDLNLSIVDGAINITYYVEE